MPKGLERLTAHLTPFDKDTPKAIYFLSQMEETLLTLRASNIRYLEKGEPYIIHPDVFKILEEYWQWK